MSDQWSRFNWPGSSRQRNYQRELPQNEKSEEEKLFDSITYQKQRISSALEKEKWAIAQIEEINSRYGTGINASDNLKRLEFLSSIFAVIDISDISDITDSNKQDIRKAVATLNNTPNTNWAFFWASDYNKYQFIDLPPDEQWKIYDMSPENHGDYNVSLRIKIGEGETIAVKSWCYKNTKGREREDHIIIEILN